jgi:hypothetical protein
MMAVVLTLIYQLTSMFGDGIKQIFYSLLTQFGFNSFGFGGGLNPESHRYLLARGFKFQRHDQGHYLHLQELANRYRLIC